MNAIFRGCFGDDSNVVPRRNVDCCNVALAAGGRRRTSSARRRSDSPSEIIRKDSSPRVFVELSVVRTASAKAQSPRGVSCNPFLIPSLRRKLPQHRSDDSLPILGEGTNDRSGPTITNSHVAARRKQSRTELWIAEAQLQFALLQSAVKLGDGPLLS